MGRSNYSRGGGREEDFFVILKSLILGMIFFNLVSANAMGETKQVAGNTMDVADHSTSFHRDPPHKSRKIGNILKILKKRLPCPHTWKKPK